MLDYITKFYEVVQVLFIAVGVLKVVARYTKWKWDDRIFDALEKPLRQVRDFVRKER